MLFMDKHVYIFCFLLPQLFTELQNSNASNSHFWFVFGWFFFFLPFSSYGSWIHKLGRSKQVKAQVIIVAKEL